MQTRKIKLNFRRTYFLFSSISTIRNFLFFRLWLLLLRYNSRASSFSLYDSYERCFCVWAREYARVCARSEQRDTVVRKPLYPYVAHHDKFWNIYGSARGVHCKSCGKSFRFFTPLAAAVFQVQQQQQPSKRLGCHRTTAAHQAFPFVTATNGASTFGFVSVRTCARRVNSVIQTVVL